MPKIEAHESIKHAKRILAEVRKIWPKKWDGWVKHWSNGREQGYYLQASIWNLKKGERCSAACVFSEARSSDSALVVCGESGDFDYGSNQPSDHVWDSPDHRRYFGDLDGLRGVTWVKEKHDGRGDKAAAKWIIKRLREIMRQDLKYQREAAKDKGTPSG